MIDKKPCVRITLTNTKPSVFESKIGGYGYIPHDGDFPHDDEGNQLRLLAQIDCSQVDFENFPKSGLLQFWILNDELYGWDSGKLIQDTFRVIYYPETDATVTEEEIASKFVKNAYDEEYPLPIDKECGMLFASGESFLCPEIDLDADEEEEEKLWDEYGKLTSQYPNHQIGGYPYFTQDDPRDEDGYPYFAQDDPRRKQNAPYDFLLFQLDSDSDKVLWGDVGIGNFFINTEKLKNLDFTDVLYNWDCG